MHAFLEKKIPFLAIPEVIEGALAKTVRVKPDAYEALLETDLKARSYANEMISRK